MRTKTPSTQGKCGNILLVDDHKLGLAARKSILEELGHNVITATNGQSAYELIQEQDFDLMITDLRMPKLNGLELITKLRQEQYEMPIILLSALADAVGEEECCRIGADVVLRKSANEVTQMVSAVKRLLNRKPRRKPAQKEEDSAGNSSSNALLNASLNGHAKRKTS